MEGARQEGSDHGGENKQGAIVLHQLASKTQRRRKDMSLNPLEKRKDQRAASMLVQMAKDGALSTDSDHGLTDDLQRKTGILFDTDTELDLTEPIAAWGINNGLDVLAPRLSKPLLQRLFGGVHRYLVLHGFHSAETVLFARGQDPELFGRSLLKNVAMMGLRRRSEQ